MLFSVVLSNPVTSVPGNFGPFDTGTVSLLLSTRYTGWYGADVSGLVARMYDPLLALPFGVE